MSTPCLRISLFLKVYNKQYLIEGHIMKKTSFITSAILLSFVTLAQAIDINTSKYDMITIVTNASSNSLNAAIKDELYSFSSSPHKIMKAIDFNCKSLGFKLSPPDPNFDTKFPNYTATYYNKQESNGVESTCTELKYHDGSNSAALLIDGND